MIFTNVQTYYISSSKSGAPVRYVRYDLIRTDIDTFLVKVFDDQKKSLSPPYSLHQVDEFTVSRANYIARYNIGSPTVRDEMPPTFEGYVDEYLQDHRNKSD